jgi:hypothetical protein
LPNRGAHYSLNCPERQRTAAGPSKGNRDLTAAVFGAALHRPRISSRLPSAPATWFTGIAILPTFVVMLGIFGMPLAFSFYLSFTDYAQGQGLFSGGYVGLENYQDLLSDPVFTGKEELHTDPAPATRRQAPVEVGRSHCDAAATPGGATVDEARPAGNGTRAWRFLGHSEEEKDDLAGRRSAPTII